MSAPADIGGHQVWLAHCSCGYARSCEAPEEATRAAETHQLLHKHHGEPAAFHGAGAPLRLGVWTSARAW